MVCKEEVFTWFQNLQAHKRIEAMYMFLNMCYPLELRFCGTCLEDLARKEYYVLREKELEANNITEVSKIRNIHDQQVRNHLTIVLSLLNSSNTLCAKEIFRILSEEIKLDVLASLRIYSNPKLVDQYLLLLTLAQHHPAFDFSQQNYLAELSTSIENCLRELNPRTKYEVIQTLRKKKRLYFTLLILRYLLQLKSFTCPANTVLILLMHPKFITIIIFP